MTSTHRCLAALVLVLCAPVAGAFTAQSCGVGVPGERKAGLDDDRDGVPDSEDWCMETPANTPVGSSGCADWEVPVRCERKAAAVVPTPPAAAPRTDVPPPKPVDTDADGVVDALDLCAGTPAGTAVDASGCVDIEKVVLKGVSFAMGSAQLLPESHATLRGVAEAMKASPQLKVEIGGHTDSIGEQAKNQRLSQRRAESVRRFLAGEGVDAARLTAKGYGESQPVASNETDAGRAENRRVEFKIVKGS